MIWRPRVVVVHRVRGSPYTNHQVEEVQITIIKVHRIVRIERERNYTVRIERERRNRRTDHYDGFTL